MVKIVAFIICIFSFVPAFAATYNVTPNSSPSLAQAFSSAVAGDTIILSGGTYSLSSTLRTGNNGSNDTAGRIVVRAASGETPILTGTGLPAIIRIERLYWTIDGISMVGASVPTTNGSGTGIIVIGEDGTGNYATIQNCKLTLSSTVGHDNVATIVLKSNRSNYALIKNNILQAYYNGNNYSLGIQYLGGGNIGTRVLNNEISGGQCGVMVKHANSDTSATGAEIAYNYFYNNLYDFYGNPVYINYHDNIGKSGILLGDNGGGVQGHHNTINHNTHNPGIIELWNPSEGPITSCKIINNIFGKRTTYGTTLQNSSWNYNIYGNGTAVGANDLGNSSPTYSGGSNPSEISGFALAVGSKGINAGSDGKDLGADVSMVGSSKSGVTIPADVIPPEGLRLVQ